VMWRFKIRLPALTKNTLQPTGPDGAAGSWSCHGQSLLCAVWTTGHGVVPFSIFG